AMKGKEEGLAMGEKLGDGHPAVTEFQSYLANSYHNMAYSLYRTGKPAEALEGYEKARDIQRRLAEANPTVTLFQRELAWTYTSIGLLLSATGRPAERRDSLG